MVVHQARAVLRCPRHRTAGAGRGPRNGRGTAFTGDIIDAARAQQMGLSRSCHDQLLPTAKDLARKIASNPPLAVRKLKNGLRRALDRTGASSLVVSSLSSCSRPRIIRGVRSFLEKREPHFVGR